MLLSQPSLAADAMIAAVAEAGGAAAASAPAATPTGYQAAARAFEAYARKDYAAAVAAAREAVQASPAERTYQVLLMNALAAAGALAEADAAGEEIERRFGPSAEVEAQRGYIVRRLGRPQQAASLLFAALQRDGLPPEAVRVARLSLADALLETNRPAEAVQALAPLAVEPSYEVQSRRAVALAAGADKLQAAQVAAGAAKIAPDPGARAFMTRLQVLSLIQAGRKSEAGQVFRAAMASGALQGSSPADLAMLAVGAGEDELALEQFRTALQAGVLTGTQALDAAYAAKRLHEDGAAGPYFRLSLDKASAGDISLSDQARLNIRRELAQSERTWSGSLYVGYGASGSTATAGVPGANGRGVTQVGGEVDRLIRGLPGGASALVFARAFETAASERTSDATGGKTLQGWLGVQAKPFAAANLVLEASRLVKLGRLSRNDWMLRAGYSAGRGLDLRRDSSAWTTWSVYADAARILGSGESLATLDARVGRGYQLTADGKTLVSAYVGAQASYDTGFAHAWAAGVGPGVTLRRWFRETTYKAPQSFIDLSLQWRARLVGDNRGRGLFAVLSVSF